MAKKNDHIKNIRSRFLSRGYSLAKVSLRAGSKAATQAISGAFSGNQDPDKINKYIYSQIELLTNELGQLKGSLMKVGQMLSTYGEHFLPKEANDLLKSLQFQSPPVSWEVVEEVLKKELGPERLNELEVEKGPYASASIGQVHRATRKSDGNKLAVKIQYPGVDKAIDNDLRFLKMIFSFTNLIPKGPRFDQIFSEVKTMLHQEVDYRNELTFTQKFYELLKDDSRFLVPEVYPEYSSQKVITTSFMEGVPVDSDKVLSLPLERRNHLGRSFLELYLRELTEFGLVQTDPHLGNYRVRLGENDSDDQLVLLDFGAMRAIEKSFLAPYHKVIWGALIRDDDVLLEGARDLGFVKEGDSEELVQSYIELCQLITEPFNKAEWPETPDELIDSSGNYDWGQSDLPKRVARKAGKIIVSFRLRTPPNETVFLDRKLGGAFVFLSVLNCKMNARDTAIAQLKDPPLLR